jgi:hypothetical protein
MFLQNIGTNLPSVFINRQAVARYWALASLITGPCLIEKKNLLGRGLTKVENHCIISCNIPEDSNVQI